MKLVLPRSSTALPVAEHGRTGWNRPFYTLAHPLRIALPGSHFIGISSRKNRIEDIEVMNAIIVRTADRQLANAVAGIWCDGKLGAAYIVTLWQGYDHRLKDVFDAVRASAVEVDGGYNWLGVETADGRSELSDSGHWPAYWQDTPD